MGTLSTKSIAPFLLSVKYQYSNAPLSDIQFAQQPTTVLTTTESEFMIVWMTDRQLRG